MEIYFIFIFILFLFSGLEVSYQNKTLNNNMLFVVYILSILIIGLRWKTGTDWEAYQYAFEKKYINLQDASERNTNMEIGYVMLNYFLREFTDNYSVFLFLHSVVYYFFVLYGLNKITNYPISSYLFLFCSSLGMVGANRQLIAVGFIFYALSFAIEKKKKYFIYILIAIQFHITSITTSVLYFLNRKVETKVILVVLLVALAIGFTPLPMQLFSMTSGISERTLDKVTVYSEMAEGSSSIIGYLKRLSFVGLFLLVRNKVEKEYANYNFFLNTYMISIVLYLIFGNTLSVVVSRGSFYFNLVEGILLTAPFYIIKDKPRKMMYLLLVLVLSIVFMYQSIALYPELFDPYKALWYNQYYHRIMN